MQEQVVRGDEGGGVGQASRFEYAGDGQAVEVVVLGCGVECVDVGCDLQVGAFCDCTCDEGPESGIAKADDVYRAIGDVAQCECDVVYALGIVGAVKGVEESLAPARFFGVFFADVLARAEGVYGIDGLTFVEEGMDDGGVQGVHAVRVN